MRRFFAVAGACAAVLLSATPVAGAAPGDIYVIDPFALPGSAPAVLRVTGPNAQTVVSPTGNIDMTAFGMLYQAGGTALIANGADANILRVDLTTGAQTVAASGGDLQGPKGLAPAPNGDVYVADETAKKILRINPANGAQTPVASANLLDAPRGVAVAANGDLYVADAPDDLIRVNPANGDQTRVTQGNFLANVQSVAVGSNGDVFVASFNGAIIVRVPAGTTNQEKLAEGNLLVSPQGMALDVNGDLLVTDSAAFGNSGIIRINLATKQQSPVTQNGSLADARGIAVEPLAPAQPAPPGPSTPAPDKTIVATVKAKSVQRLGSYVVVEVTCPSEACTATARASIPVPRVKASKTYKLSSVKRSLTAGKKAKLKLRLKKSVQRAIRRALSARKKVRAKVRVTTTDAAKNSTAKTLRIRLKR